MSESVLSFRGLVLICCSLLVCIASGCARDGQTRRSDASKVGDRTPVQVQLTIGLPFDSDGNGYPDTMQAIAYLFPDSRVTAIPVRASGTFEFVMHNPQNELIARWVFPPDVVARAERNLPAGPGYSMALRLTPMQDAMPPTAGDIRCQFIDENGNKIRSTGRTTVRLGG